jgi:hypothetical protein
MLHSRKNYYRTITCGNESFQVALRIAMLRISFIFFPFGGPRFELSDFCGQLEVGNEGTVMNNVTCPGTGDSLAPVQG